MPRPLRVAALALLLALPGACQVVRSQEGADTGPADLPSLRRASVALQDRIRRERAHVDEYNRQLAGLGADEKRLYATIQGAEETVELLQSDLEGALLDLDLIQEEMDLTREDRARLAGELEGIQRERAVAEQELLAVRAAADRALAELAAERDRLAAARDGLEALAAASAPSPTAVLELASGLDGSLRGAGVPSPGPLAWALLLDRAVRPWTAPPRDDR